MRAEVHGKISKTKRNRLNMRKKDELMNIQEKMIKLDTRVRTGYTVCSTTSYTGCSATWEFPIMNKCGVVFQFSIQGMFIDDFVY